MTALNSSFDNVEGERQVNILQHDIETLNNEYQTSAGSLEREQIIETIEAKEQILSELKCKLQETLEESQAPRRSVRPRNLTPKMLALQKEEIQRKERKLLSMYEKWKMLARKARDQLKSDITESQIASLIDILEEGKENVMQLYVEVRDHVTPSTELRRRIDACEAVTTDIIKVAYERISGIDEFDSEQAKHRLRELLESSYARSIYGSTVTRISHRSTTQLSHHTVSSLGTSKQAEAAAELAAKEVEYNILMEENKQKEKIQELRDKQERDLNVQKRELEKLQAEKDLRVAQARFEAYNRMAVQEVETNPATNYIVGEQHCLPQISSSQPANKLISSSQNELPSLIQAMQDSINLNRLPAPEPFVFNGDPIQYVEWKASFMSLIDRKSISAADKLYYLKRYVGGSAHKALNGTFYRSDNEAYTDAWSRLDQRYGQPFVIQRAFRQKLANWPKIQSRDAVGLREFSDFLNACQDAMAHVANLQILNDCEENQRLVQKLPEWAASRWNRQVTQTLRDHKDFPDFKAFAAFVSLEAEIGCNPVTSSYALSLVSAEKRNSRESKGNKVNVLNTQTDMGHDRQRSIKKNTKPPCVFCQDPKHQLYDCSKLMAKTLVERREYVKENNICYGCLKIGHRVRDCRHRLFCNTCKGKHPTCFHDDNYIKGERSVPVTSSDSRSDNSTAAVSLSVSGKGSSYTSMVVPVWVSSSKDVSTEKLVYALLDSQSDTTFIDQEISNVLQVDKSPVRLKLTTMSGKDTIVKSERISGLRVRGYSSATYIELPPVYTKDCIPVNQAHIPTCETAKLWNHLSAIIYEMPSLKDCEAGLLIGYNCARALAPRQVILGSNDEPYAVKTDLGWSIVGPSLPCPDSSSVTGICHRLSVKEIPPLTPADAIRVLESDFKDVNDDDKTLSQDDITFLNKLSDGIRKNCTGHYEMPLPFKERPKLPDNRQLALVRLNHLKRKLLKDQRYREHYVKFMEDVIERGEAEEVKDVGIEGNKWYVPHHGVYHPKKPDKLRVVFDCSARYDGISLNDYLLQGPDLMNNLTGILLRFRQHPVALICDVEKMFHQFHVCKADRDFLRFLWWRNGDLKEQPQEYRMKVHLFGASSSPGCVNYGLRHLAEGSRDQYPLGFDFVMNNFYVDDGVTSVQTTADAIQLAREARELCAIGGLRLHKFVSSDKAVLESIPPSERANDIREPDLSFDDSLVERTLGIQWNVERDCFQFGVCLKEQPVTRRGILSTIASLYDPLGFLAPFILRGKKILQEVCRQGIGWDDTLSFELQPRWECWKRDLSNLKKVILPRTYAPPEFGKVKEVELHHFSDASTSGYGQCSYLRLKNEREDVHVALAMAKSRVSPIKITTIPRLELTAAVVSVSVSRILKEELRYTDITEFFWTDSKVVLGYINNEARRFHTFVANRVQRIHLSTVPQQWRYVPTKDNPADHVSRGLTVDELISSNWFTGPGFLWNKEIALSPSEVPELQLRDSEVRSFQTLNTKVVEQGSIVNRLCKFSSWSHVVRAIARIQRRINKDKSSGLSTVEERESAECLIVKLLQKHVFHTELKVLSKGAQLSSRNELYNLNPFLDSDGVLKVGGRLSNSSLCHSLKHPVIIPKTHHITRLIIADCHEKVKHQGKGFTINEIRSKGFWIPGINRAVASYVHNCVTCRKHRRPVEEQRMADLPSERVNPSPPFTYCGMDCFGPFSVKQGRKVYKRYGLIFTCLSSRAIHVEMIDSLSTDSFINGLRCFIALRGAVRQIRSDQGSNFVGAKNELTAALKELDVEKLNYFLVENQCDFVLNAPGASHAGGVWERQIRTVRSVLQSTLLMASERIDDSSLRSFLYEAMSIVNSRPLTVDNLSDPNSLEPITPNHFLTMKSTIALPPPGKFTREDLYARKRWRHVQYLAEQFWSRWRKEYLSNISVRQRWHTPRRNLLVGDIVIVKDSDLPRHKWSLGRVVETTIDSDGLVRRVRVHLGDKNLEKNLQGLSKPSVIERPVQKLVLLLEAC